jgi:hypothetical protein
VVSGELSDKATRHHAAVYIMRQQEGSVLGHEDAFCSSDTQNDPSFVRRFAFACSLPAMYPPRGGSNEMIGVHQPQGSPHTTLVDEDIHA